MKRTMKLLTCLSLMVITASGFSNTYAYDKTYGVYMVANSHIDAAWMWRMPKTVELCRDTFKTQIKLLNANPDFRYTQSSALYYQWMKEYNPALFEDIKQKVAQGQWEITGGQLVESDFNLPSGESLVRQYLYGKQFFQKEFGFDVKNGFAPDSFGFSYSLPQILKRSGIDTFVTTKLNWNETNLFPYELFKWEGLDGSQVIGYKPKYDYPSIFTPNDKNKINASLTRPNQLGINLSMLLWGVGDHGGGPSQEHMNYLRENDADPGMPRVSMKKLGDYFEEIASSTGKLPVWNDELYLETHRGTYTSQAAMKKYNRICETRAEQTEKFASLATWLGAITYPYEKITKAWAKINANQFHDILPGSSIHEVYTDAWDDAELALNYLNASQNQALTGISSRINTEGTGVPVIVYNPLSWERSDLVETTVTFAEKPSVVRVYAPDGSEVAAQLLSISDSAPFVAKLLFTAEKVPSLGYQVYRVEAVARENNKSGPSISISDYLLENNRFRVELNRNTGNISRIYDKVNGVEVCTGGEGNVLQVFDDSPRDFMLDAWNIDQDDLDEPLIELNTPIAMDMLESGPVRSVYRVRKRWSGSTFTQDIILYSGIDRIDIKMSADWNETNKLLKVAFPLNVRSAKASYEIPYGVIERSTSRETSLDSARFEVPGQRWADLSGNGYGISILNNSKYGWDTLDNRLRLTLLRSSKYPDPAADIGHHEFGYSIFPHRGDWRNGNTVRKGYEFNYPLVAFPTTAHPGSLPNIFSFISVNQPNVIISAIKKAEQKESGDWIMRVYETQGQPDSKVRITFAGNIREAEEVNLLEEKIGKVEFSAEQMSFNIKKYEIRTFRVSLASPYYENTRPTLKCIDLSRIFNRDGFSFNADRKDGNLDGMGSSYAAELIPREIKSEDISFILGNTFNNRKNVIDCRRQKIMLPAGRYSTIYLLAAAAGRKNQETGILKLNYRDGSNTAVSVKVRDWGATVGGWGITPIDDIIAFAPTHRHRPAGDDLVKDNYFYSYPIPLNGNKEISSIILPNNPKIKVLAISLVIR